MNVPCQSSDRRHEEAPDQRERAADEEEAPRRGPSADESTTAIEPASSGNSARSRTRWDVRLLGACGRGSSRRGSTRSRRAAPSARRPAGRSTCGACGDAPAHQSTPFCEATSPRRAAGTATRGSSGRCGARSSGGSPPSRRTCARVQADGQGEALPRPADGPDPDGGGDVQGEEGDETRPVERTVVFGGVFHGVDPSALFVRERSYRGHDSTTGPGPLGDLRGRPVRSTRSAG